MTAFDFRHGLNGYQKRLCRCEVCTAANTEPKTKDRNRKRAERGLPPNDVLQWKHGINGYQKHACRCDTCLEAKAASRTRARDRMRATRALTRPVRVIVDKPKPAKPISKARVLREVDPKPKKETIRTFIPTPTYDCGAYLSPGHYCKHLWPCPRHPDLDGAA